jgi:hypothetical protein
MSAVQKYYKIYNKYITKQIKEMYIRFIAVAKRSKL